MPGWGWPGSALHIGVARVGRLAIARQDVVFVCFGVCSSSCIRGSCFHCSALIAFFCAGCLGNVWVSLQSVCVCVCVCVQGRVTCLAYGR
jgi:hypothetical protein